MEGQELHLMAEKGHVQILTEPHYQERNAEASGAPRRIWRCWKWKGSGDDAECPAHFPVMLAESLEYLAIKPDGRYLDCTAGLGRPYGGDRGAADRGRQADRERSRRAVARDGAAECGARWADRIEFQQASFSELAESESGRVDCGPGREPVSADRSGTRIFISGGRASGHAHGSNPVA